MNRVCPWWFIGSFDNPLRRYFQDPEQILGGLVAPGQTVVDLGCGMGYFTIPLARLVGESGRVIAVDLQAQMLCGVQRRAARASLQTRIQLHQCQANTLDLHKPVDFALAFWMVHEVRDKPRFLQEVADLLKPTARFLLVEPKLHVSQAAFHRTVELARAAGLQPCAEPAIGFSQAVLFSL
jgi:ubiquinone/menaquinone biosynthesis C-methylase UbiE